MGTLPHTNPENGYALRIGKHLPQEAANLAYVHMDSPTPEKNIIVEDYSSAISENNLPGTNISFEGLVVSENGELVSENGILKLERPEILLGNRYFSEGKYPLFYVGYGQKLFDARNEPLKAYLDHSRSGQTKRFEQFASTENDRFVYAGEKIRLVYADGTALNPNEHAKIILEKSGALPFTYRVRVETDFLSGEKSCELHYPAYQDGKVSWCSEILNPTTYYTQTQGTPGNLEYALENEDGFYTVKLSAQENEPLLVEEANRPAYRFAYQIETDLQVGLSDKNPAKLNVGMIYLNDSIYNAIKATSGMKRLVKNNPFLPNYLQFDNPHHENGAIMEDSVYWLADLNMPKEHYLDYDLLILCGYGNKDVSTQADSFRAFLSKGGTLLVDNCGSGETVFGFKDVSGRQTFVADIGFSKISNESKPRRLTAEANFKDRYFVLPETTSVGSVSPSVQFFGEENLSDWTVLVGHENAGPALLSRQAEGIGRIVVSNMGLVLDALYGKEESLKFWVNYLLHLAENRSFVSPVFPEYVHHRENLYANEYMDRYGKALYSDDQSDQDETQLVAKKHLADSVGKQMLAYLPKAYRKPLSNHYRVRVKDTGEIALINAKMELPATNGQTVWSATTEAALPGWDFVFVGGTRVSGEQTNSVFYAGKRSLKVTSTSAQGFFEQTLAYLPAGQYELKVQVRCEQAQGGGIGLFLENGVPVVLSENLSGTANWKTVTLSFGLDETTTLLLRMGALIPATTGTLYFDEVILTNAGLIRMTPAGDGNELLYAYAVSAKNRDLETSLLSNRSGKTVRLETEAEIVLSVKAFVYEWDYIESRYRKEYGNKRQTRFMLYASKGETVLEKLLALLPALPSGREWAKKDRVYYEIGIEPGKWQDKVAFALYDPSVETYFYAPSGEWVINHEKLFFNASDSTVQVRAKLLSETLQTEALPFALRLQAENKIQVFAPATQEERDRWYLRVRNGSFLKKQVGAKEVADLNASGRINFYGNFLSGSHHYALPEYNRQSFYPQKGQRLVEQERAAYLDERTIKVARTPLLISEEKVEMELLQRENAAGTHFRSRHVFWNRNQEKIPYIYWDETGNNQPVRLTEGFVIDYEKGRIIFAVAKTGSVFATYSYDNFRITKRKYINRRIRKERMPSADRFTFDSKHQNWLVEPAPQFLRNNKIVHPGEYAVDYVSGTVRFFQPVKEDIYAEYSYYEEKEIAYRDANRISGEIRLAESVSFRDEIYVSYLASEESVEYKGYYDEESGIFWHLDLNPTAGHTYTSLHEKLGKSVHKEVPSEQLLGKEIYLYLMPEQSLYYTSQRTNDHCLRHAFGETQWQSIKAAHPEALLLARIQVRENTDIHQAVVLDARRYGGGLKDGVSMKRIEKQVGYTSAFWDIGSFDGLAYYKNGVTVVRVPASVLRANGGNFEEIEVRRILEKYAAYGTYAIVEYTEN